MHHPKRIKLDGQNSGAAGALSLEDDSAKSGDDENPDSEIISSSAKVAEKLTGLPCLLKGNLFVKLVNNVVLVELHVHGGLLGRDAGNQLLTYFKNKLQKKD